MILATLLRGERSKAGDRSERPIDAPPAGGHGVGGEVVSVGGGSAHGPVEVCHNILHMVGIVVVGSGGRGGGEVGGGQLQVVGSGRLT